MHDRNKIMLGARIVVKNNDDISNEEKFVRIGAKTILSISIAEPSR